MSKSNGSLILKARRWKRSFGSHHFSFQIFCFLPWVSSYGVIEEEKPPVSPQRRQHKCTQMATMNRVTITTKRTNPRSNKNKLNVDKLGSWICKGQRQGPSWNFELEPFRHGYSTWPGLKKELLERCNTYNLELVIGSAQDWQSRTKCHG